MSNYDVQLLLAAYQATRQQSLAITNPLLPEDFCLQAAAFASPPKWHLAHTTWFFETFILKVFDDGYQAFHSQYEVLFNSYYNAVGEQFPRPQRGLLSRPSLDEIIEYREAIDNAMIDLMSQTDHIHFKDIVTRCRLGIQHEKQHQELFFTDIKYSLSKNPLYPQYQSVSKNIVDDAQELQWLEFDGGLIEIGTDIEEVDFSFDNESPKHEVYLQPFQLANRLVTNAEFQAFIDDGGYKCSELWLADGWVIVQAQQWRHPLYWREHNGKAMEYTLYGLTERVAEGPVCHLSAYEADAFAQWAEARLPTEFEWEHAASQQDIFQSGQSVFHPQSVTKAAADGQPLLQLYDQCWQWTSSTYRPYPRFEASKGAIGEYNGKFMCNQWVLRGGSCVSPQNHLRCTYRNFFYPNDRWQFSGLRLANY